MMSDARKAPTLQGRGWGGAVTNGVLCEASPTPNPSPKGEGQKS